MKRSSNARAGVLVILLAAVLLPITTGQAMPPSIQKATTGDVNRKVSTSAATPAGNRPAQMEFQYTAGRGGGLELKLLLPDATSLKGFNFDDFEGPDAPSGNHKLGQLRAQSAAGAAVFDTTVSGSFATDTEFAFAVWLKAMPLSLKTKFARALAGADAKLTFTLHGFKKPSQIISSTVTDAEFLSTLGQQFKRR